MSLLANQTLRLIRLARSDWLALPNSRSTVFTVIPFVLILCRKRRRGPSSQLTGIIVFGDPELTIQTAEGNPLSIVVGINHRHGSTAG